LEPGWLDLGVLCLPWYLLSAGRERQAPTGLGSAVHDQQLPLLVPPTRWLRLVDRRAFNGRARSFKAGIRGELSFKARSRHGLLVEEGAAGDVARVAVMALARSKARNADALPSSASVGSRSSIVACCIPAMMSGRQSPRPSRWPRRR
jgi:hypothetical protein